MNYQQEYISKLQSPDQAVKIVKSGDNVQYNSFNGVPPALDLALSKRRDELQGVIINTSIALYPLHTITSDPTGEHFLYHNWHASEFDRQFANSGNFYYVPFLYYEMPIALRRKRTIDVVMLHVTPMDENGYFNFGPSVAQARPILDSADKVIVEVNKNMPVVNGEEHNIHISEVDIIVEGNNPEMLTLPAPKPGIIDEKIANLVLAEIEDGSCIQLGIGKMPNAVGKLIAESDLKDLGIHTEMLADAHMLMYETGRVTGKNKIIDNEKMVYGFAMGSKELYDFIDRNPACKSYPISYINAPSTIARNPKVIAINNAIEVDLFSQINSESVGTRHISGTGGQVDFMLGSFMSQDGKGIICMSSTFTDKKGNVHSRIRPTLPPGTIVTVPRTIAQYIITEYGTINVKGKSTWERAEALISIAHPDFRDELIKEAQQMGIWRRSSRIA